MPNAADRRTAPRYVNPSTLAKPVGYSNGVRYGNAGAAGVMFLAGQIGWNANARLVSDRFADQFDQALANVLAIVAEAGGGPESIGKLTIYVVDVAEYTAARQEIGRRYRERMGKHYPAMTLVEVKGLLEPGARVEIEGVAWL
jgi:enamine deaminase RidA (YjgF/YER057c/UK114 family)